MLPQLTSLYAKAEEAFEYCERYNTLMEDSKFGLLDNMQVARCAEGESCILMAKMANDRVRAGDVPNCGEEELKIVEELKKSSLTAEMEKAYYLSELVMDRLMQKYVGPGPIPKGVGRTFADDFHLSRL